MADSKPEKRFIVIQTPMWEHNLAPQWRDDYPEGAYVSVARCAETGEKAHGIAKFPSKPGDEREIQFQRQDQDRVRKGIAACIDALKADVAKLGGVLVGA